MENIIVDDPMYAAFCSETHSRLDILLEKTDTMDYLPFLQLAITELMSLYDLADMMERQDLRDLVRLLAEFFEGSMHVEQHEQQEILICCQQIMQQVQQVLPDGKEGLEQLHIMLQSLQDMRSDSLSEPEPEQDLASQNTKQRAEQDSTQQNQQQDFIPCIADDVPAELLDALLQEAPDYVAIINKYVANLLELSENSTSNNSSCTNDAENKINLDCLAHIQRASHTLKGAANTVGIIAIAKIMHQMEDLVEYAMKHKYSANDCLCQLLLEASDFVQECLEYLQGQSPHIPQQGASIYVQLQQWQQQLEHGKIPTILPNIPQSQQQPQQQQEIKQAEEQNKEQNEEQNKEQNKEQNEDESESLKVTGNAVNKLIGFAGELGITSHQLQTRMQLVEKQQRSLDKKLYDTYQNCIALHEELLDSSSDDDEIDIAITNKQDNYKEFDALELDRYNNWYSMSNALLESLNDSRAMLGDMCHNLNYTRELQVQQDRLQRDVHYDLLQMRTLPFGQFQARFERVVRQASRSTGKQILLHCSGMNALIDADNMNKLADAIMHLLRNSVDHGIETAETRINSGKKERGNIWLRYFRSGADYVIVCQDDGRGLDTEGIRKKALAQGLIANNNNTLHDDKSLQRLILEQGFSTTDTVSQLSGRGFGMNIVQNTVRKLRGRIDIDSTRGEGCTFTLRFPSNLSRIHSLLVEVDGRRFAIPSRDITHVYGNHEGYIDGQQGQQQYFHYDNQRYIIHSLSELLWGKKQIQQTIENKDQRDKSQSQSQSKITKHTLIVHIESGLLAITVDNTLGCMELITKQRGYFVPKCQGVMACSILGSGDVVALLNISTLLNATKNRYNIQHNKQSPSNIRTDQQPLVMIVDDSLSVRRSLSQLLYDTGYKVQTAVDGSAAILAISKQQPDILILDLEMPQMNGIEVCEHLRHEENTNTLPIIMLTSRATNKHRERAMRAGVQSYMIKPWQDDILLDEIAKFLLPA
ncbi:MAG: response regulator [Mariprofundales bacterium]